MIRWVCGLLFRDFRTVPMRATLFPVEFRLLQVLKRCSQRMRASSLWTLYKLIYLPGVRKEKERGGPFGIM